MLIFPLYPLLQVFFPLVKAGWHMEQVVDYFCQLRWSWFFRSLHALLKQMQIFWEDTIFYVAFLYHCYLVGRNMYLYHNDLKLHLQYFCTPLSISRVCFSFNFIFIVKHWNFCVHKTWSIEYRTVSLGVRFQRFSDSLGEHWCAHLGKCCWWMLLNQ